ncbi:hypothetical protein VM1G_10171 [Cytospora mali]|uniref:Uncharacterized protein n=1 Tax=Cytospora mali TaxID=578113 RepID=A0A194WDR1_CYTMA|nr:hypothetical protein VM1G_10171 [Valsa mali]
MTTVKIDVDLSMISPLLPTLVDPWLGPSRAELSRAELALLSCSCLVGKRPEAPEAEKTKPVTITNRIIKAPMTQEAARPDEFSRCS